MSLLTLAGLAATLVLSDRTIPGLNLAVTPETLKCSASRPDASFPVNGDLVLQFPSINDLTTLTHFAQIGHNSLAETCAGVPALLARAEAQGGKLPATAHVVLTRSDDTAGGPCRYLLAETVTLTLGGSEPFRELTSTTTQDDGACR